MRNLARRAVDALKATPPRVVARHVIPTVIASMDDLTPPPTPELLDIALAAFHRARSIDLRELWERIPDEDAAILATWPGEHYRLLAALVASTGAASVVEVGTDRGIGALAMHIGAPDAHITTFDILAPSAIPGSLLQEPHPSIETVIGDLADPDCFRNHADLMQSADLIFVDGPKDVAFEANFFSALIEVCGSEHLPLTVVDDIRVPSMLALWRDLPVPKLDITSFGHWSGTGLLLGTEVSRGT